MVFSKLTRWFEGVRRASAEGRPRESCASLPAIEQFERRFCLGTVAAATIDAWSSELGGTAADELVLADPGKTQFAALETETDAPTSRQVAVETFSGDEPATEQAETYAVSDSAPLDAVEQEPLLVSSDVSSSLYAADGAGADATAGSELGALEATAAAITAAHMMAMGAPDSSGGGSASSNGGDYDLSTNGSAVGINAETAYEGFQRRDQPFPLTMTPPPVGIAPPELTAGEVADLLARGSGATSSEDAIIAVVDRNGRILGVRVEDDVLAAIPDMATLVFAIDGAVAKARTAAMFSSNAAPLTSRTIRFISQSTITQREVESNPNVDNTDLATALASTVRGPGFVAPIGVGGHFPPEIVNTPLVDLFGIEHTNRDSTLAPGPDGVKGTPDDITLRTNADGTGRFNIDPTFVPAGQGLYAPESYGTAQNSGLLPDATARGIATLPGGIPLFRDTNADGFGDLLVGGIGVFFPGVDGYATHEQGFVQGSGQTEFDHTNSFKVLEAEYIALAAAGGSLRAAIDIDPRAKSFSTIAGVGAVPNLDLPFGRIDLVGITLEIVGPQAGECGGFETVLDVGAFLGEGVVNGADQPLLGAPDGFHREGLAVPEGYLVLPHDATDGSGLTAFQVNEMIQTAVLAANETRAAIRLPLGSRTRMVFAVTDTNGEVLGLYRMPDATTFSIDVAVAKARNVAYYSDFFDLQAIDQVPGVPRGTAFTNRTFRFLAQPRFPSGIDYTAPPEFSILNDDLINTLTAENVAGPAPVAAFDSVYGHDSFFVMSNFHDPGDVGVVAAAGADQRTANQNGVVFFPGSTPLYINSMLVGGFGVSGDGVDQDDVVTFLGARNYLPSPDIGRADQAFYRGVRLPYQKFLRNPFG